MVELGCNLYKKGNHACRNFLRLSSKLGYERYEGALAGVWAWKVVM